jgi:hypothetical protein
LHTALCVIRNEPSYRKEFFVEGLRRAGFAISGNLGHKPNREDVLLVWNRHGAHDGFARRFESVGARVIVAENGWIGKDRGGHKLYALCLAHHNGAGTWRVGEADRWEAGGYSCRPWRAPTGSGHILVLPQRGIGERAISQPPGWTHDVVRRLRRVTGRPIRVREHPGRKLKLNDAVLPPLNPDLEGAWACVTWGSGAGIKALVAGVPVFYEMPKWIGADAAKRGIAEIENPFLGDRLPMLRRLCWAQWSAEEIATGEPIKWLLT